MCVIRNPRDLIFFGEATLRGVRLKQKFGTGGAYKTLLSRV